MYLRNIRYVFNRHVLLDKKYITLLVGVSTLWSTTISTSNILNKDLTSGIAFGFIIMDLIFVAGSIFCTKMAITTYRLQMLKMYLEDYKVNMVGDGHVPVILRDIKAAIYNSRLDNDIILIKVAVKDNKITDIYYRVKGMNNILRYLRRIYDKDKMIELECELFTLT